MTIKERREAIYRAICTYVHEMGLNGLASPLCLEQNLIETGLVEKHQAENLALAGKAALDVLQYWINEVRHGKEEDGASDRVSA